MSWLTIWWQQIRGYTAPDPWEHDRHIVAARREQHARIDQATRLLAREGMALRKERRFWSRYGGGPPKKQSTDDG